ncbi:hypothetical protein [Streptomyces sp. NPDC001389]|uniref:hypothetical protein n=1 Tax=Streptomyces sp. NPDC001389 TaxID=3364569 RepID=UPI0036764C19
MAVHRVIVYPPDDEGTRMVRYDGVILGRAFKAPDIAEFLRAAGMPDAEDVDLTGPLFEWREIGPESWAESPPERASHHRVASPPIVSRSCCGGGCRR